MKKWCLKNKIGYSCLIISWLSAQIHERELHEDYKIKLNKQK